MNTYKEVNGTSYQKDTSDEVISVLEKCRRYETRIILDYGDTETGRSWNEVYDITGYVSRSSGDIKIPILVYNKRSMGGKPILDRCIIKISESRGKRVLYQLKNK